MMLSDFEKIMPPSLCNLEEEHELSLTEVTFPAPLSQKLGSCIFLAGFILQLFTLVHRCLCGSAFCYCTAFARLEKIPTELCASNIGRPIHPSCPYTEISIACNSAIREILEKVFCGEFENTCMAVAQVQLKRLSGLNLLIAMMKR